MSKSKRRITALIGTVLAFIGLSFGSALQASAATEWKLCNSKVLQGSSSATWFCVTWIDSWNATNQRVVRPKVFEIDSGASQPIYETREDIGKQNGSVPGNVIHYTDEANHTANPGFNTLYLPSSSGYWIVDVPDGPNPTGDGQAFVNVWLAVSGHAYEAITVYDTP